VSCGTFLNLDVASDNAGGRVRPHESQGA